MAKLVNLIPNKELKTESIEDMDVNLPAKVEKFLERALQIIKSYSLTRKKEQLIMARLVDALGMTPQDLAAAVQRLKKYKIAKK